MQRVLLILRHGKSSWDDYETDFERPLNKRGNRAARFMGKFIRKLGLKPDAIVSSPAERALSTAELVGEKLKLDEIYENKQLYHAGCSALMDVIEKLDNSWQTVLIVGHNPGLEDLVDELTGSRDTLMKTCSLAVLSTDVQNWADAHEFDLKALYHPRELMGEE